MSKKTPPSSPKKEEIHMEVEEWQWEPSTTRFGWKQWLILALLLAGGLLFAFGFLIVAIIAFGLSLIFGLVWFILKKLES